MRPLGEDITEILDYLPGAFRGDPRAMLYRYTPDRRGEHPRAHLAEFRGILQADGYAGLAGLYSNGRVVEAACTAHARQKFFVVQAATRSPLDQEALNKIAALYAIERDIRGSPAAERLRVRMARTVPLMAELHAWLQATHARLPGRGELAKAIRYSLSRWDALTLVLRDGRACPGQLGRRAGYAADRAGPAQLDLCRV